MSGLLTLVAPDVRGNAGDMRSALVGMHQGRSWAPESRSGRWTIALAGMSVAGVVLSVVGFATGVVESASSFSDNWLLTGWGVAVLVSGAASVIAGSLAITRRHDHSWGVLLASGFGILVTALMLQQVAEGLV